MKTNFSLPFDRKNAQVNLYTVELPTATSPPTAEKIIKFRRRELVMLSFERETFLGQTMFSCCVFRFISRVHRDQANFGCNYHSVVVNPVLFF